MKPNIPTTYYQEKTCRLWAGSSIAALIGLIALLVLNNRLLQPVCIMLGSASTILLFRRFRKWRLESLLLKWLDKNAIYILFIYIATLLTWYGLVLWANPYRYEINNGDAAFTTQTLYNFVNGFLPENSVFTMNGQWTTNDDVRYVPNGIGYVSVFSLHQYISPWLFTTPLYALYPEPPMHIWAIQIVTLSLGIPGIFWTCRQIGNSRLFALACAIAFSLLPQVETQIWFQGYFDPIALGFMPWVFGSLFGRRWICLGISALMLALISLPFSYFVIIFGIICSIFYRATVPGIMVALIGWCVMRFDTSLFLTAYQLAQGSTDHLPNFFHKYVLDRTFESFVDPFCANATYVISMLFFVGFLPFAVTCAKKQIDLASLGFLAILATAFSLMMLRSTGWEANRNALFITPIFIMSVYSCTNVTNQCLNNTLMSQEFKRSCRELLLSSLGAGIIFYHPYKEGPLASHLPWGGNGTILTSRETHAWDETILILNKYVPRDAPIVWDSAPEIVAVLANRQHNWHCGRAPKNIKYFVSVGEPRNGNERDLRDTAILAWRNDPSARVLYEGNPGQRLLIFERSNSTLPYRHEDQLGWNIVTSALGIGK